MRLEWLYMSKKNKKEKKDEKWTIEQEIESLERNLKTMAANDPMREPTEKAILMNEEILAKRRESKRSTWKDIVAMLGTIGTIALSAFGLSRAYAIDRSEAIVQNKTTQNYFHKVFKL